jgi:hypothetical protein
MAAIQLNFSLRTSSNCKSVHLLGSWDNYTGQLPLSKDSSKSGAWKGSFRFQGSTLKQGQRYWYYYIIDGYHVSHDPAKDHVVEPTTGRKLNTLDVPAGKGDKTSSSAREKAASKRASRRVSADIPKGRSLSPSEIKSPKPVKPGQTRHIVNADYTYGYEQLAAQLAAAQLSAQYAEDDSDDSDADSDVPSLSSGSSRSDASSPSSVSSRSSSCCTCERYGITRNGERVLLDCKGARCGYSDDSSDCSSESDEEVYRVRQTRRQGMYMQQ